MGQEVPGAVAVTARVEAAVGTDAASSPAVIGHYCIPDWAGNRGVLLLYSIKGSHSQRNPFPHTPLPGTNILDDFCTINLLQ